MSWTDEATAVAALAALAELRLALWRLGARVQRIEQGVTPTVLPKLPAARPRRWRRWWLVIALAASLTLVGGCARAALAGAAPPSPAAAAGAAEATSAALAWTAATLAIGAVACVVAAVALRSWRWALAALAAVGGLASALLLEAVRPALPWIAGVGAVMGLAGVCWALWRHRAAIAAAAELGDDLKRAAPPEVREAATAKAAARQAAAGLRGLIAQVRGRPVRDARSTKRDTSTGSLGSAEAHGKPTP